MRYDMAQVVIERPRAGGRYDYHDVRVRYKGLDIEKLEDLPKHEGYRRSHRRDRKSFTDLLGPLEGYLRSHIGDKWDDVYSDICSHLNPNSTTQIHILGHVFQFIDVKTYWGDDGKVYAHASSRFYGGPHLVSWGDLYVHPDTGIICAMPERKRFYNPAYENAVKRLRVVFGNEYRKITDDKNNWGYRGYQDNVVVESRRHIRVGPEKELHKMDGIWYWAVFSDVPPPFTQSWFDTASGETKTRTILRGACDYWTGISRTEGRYRSDRKQANRRALRRYRIHND